MSKVDYVNNFILKELTSSSWNHLVKTSNNYGIYVVRIKLPYEEKYMYKIGKTIDIEERMCSLMDEFNFCDGEIILLFYGKPKNILSETHIHQVLRQKYEYGGLKDKFGRKSNEVYNISSDLYDEIALLFSELTNDNYFESQRYIINDNNVEHYVLQRYIIDYFVPSNLDNFKGDLKGKKCCLLGGFNNKYEGEFWTVIKTKFLDSYHSDHSDSDDECLEEESGSLCDFIEDDNEYMDMDDDYTELGDGESSSEIKIL